MLRTHHNFLPSPDYWLPDVSHKSNEITVLSPKDPFSSIDELPGGAAGIVFENQTNSLISFFQYFCTLRTVRFTPNVENGLNAPFWGS